MKNSVKISKELFTTILTITLFVIYILTVQSNDHWVILLILLLFLQLTFKSDSRMIFPLLASLTLTEYYFLISGKRFYLAEFLFYPLIAKYLINNYSNKVSKLKIKVNLLFALLVLVHLINYSVGLSEFLSMLYRLRSFAFPLILIVIVANLVKDETALIRIINLIIIVSIVSTIVVFLQYYTGNFYILQKELPNDNDTQRYMQQYIQGTEDSIFFNFLGLKILGEIPPVGLNYYKFGYSERIIVPFTLCFSLLLFAESKPRKMMYWILSLLFFIATLFTGSRSVLLTLLLVMLILWGFLRNKIKWKYVNITIALFFGLIYFLAPTLKLIKLEEFGTLLSRITYMDDFYNFIISHPLTLLIGANPDAFMAATRAAQPPHHFLAFGIIYEGLIVTLIIFGSLYLLFNKTYKVKHEKSKIIAIHYGLWVSIFAFYFIYGQTSYVTWSTPHNMFFFIMIGLLVASCNILCNYDLHHHPRT